MATSILTEKRFTLAHLGVTALASLVLYGLLSLAVKFLFTNPPTTTSPLKVRGGAMTLRTAPKTDFGKGSDGSPCVVLPSSGATMELYQDPTGPNTPILKNPDKSQPLNDGVQFDLVGHKVKVGGPSTNGVRIYIKTGCGPTNSLGAFLSVDSDGKGNTRFYKFRQNQPDDDLSYAKRFLDGVCEKPTTSGTANDQYQDEDSCEHLSTIYVNINQPPTPTLDYISHAKDAWPCTNGECVLLIRPVP